MNASGADLHAWVHRGVPGDVEFYRRVCRGAGTVLELGCGDGRILLPLARDGLAATGLDLEGDLIDRARMRAREAGAATAGRISLLRADMREFDLGTRFDRILIPFGGLYCMLEDGDALSCLRSARRHASPGARLFLDGYLFVPPADPGSGPIRSGPGPLTRIETSDRSVEVLEEDVWWPERQRIDATYVYRIRARGSERTERRTIPQRYLLPGQIATLLRAAGWRRTAHWGGFGGEPLRPDSRHQVVRAEPA